MRPTPLVLAGALLLAGSAAQARELALAVEGGYFDMVLARKSAKAVFGGSSGGAAFGGQVRVGLSPRLFLAVGARYFQKDGERAFAVSKTGESFSLGHPLTVRTVPAYALVAYRFTPDARLSPYVGLGLGVTSYHEESTVAGIAEEPISATKPSGHLVVGAEWGRGSLRFGTEVMLSTAPNTLGEGGISKVYGESDAGGVSVVGKLVYVR